MEGETDKGTDWWYRLFLGGMLQTDGMGNLISGSLQTEGQTDKQKEVLTKGWLSGAGHFIDRQTNGQKDMQTALESFEC